MTNAQSLDSREFLRHCLATLAYRGGKVLRDAPADFGAFRAGETSRTPSQILAHLCDLLDWMLSFVRGQETWHNSTPGAWHDDVNRFFAALQAVDEALAQPGPIEYPWARVFQGPIADALTHVGQLAFLRRLAGSPVKGENYFKAEIASGRVGPGQAPPLREF